MMQILVGRSKLAWGAFHWAAWLSEAPGHWTGWGSRICTSRRGRARCRPPPARPLSGSAPPGRPQAGASPRWPSRNHRPARASVMMVGRCKRKQKRVTGWAVAHQVQDNVRLGARRWCGWLAGAGAAAPARAHGEARQQQQRPGHHAAIHGEPRGYKIAQRVDGFMDGFYNRYSSNC